VTLAPDKDDLKRELNQKIRQSTVLPCWSCATRTRSRRGSISRTPLLFSIHEAKGLEYENIVRSAHGGLKQWDDPVAF